MNTQSQTEDRVRADMINEALTLLSIIDAEQSDEDINEDPASRKARLTLRAMSQRLVTEMIAQLRPATTGSMPRSFQSFAA